MRSRRPSLRSSHQRSIGTPSTSSITNQGSPSALMPPSEQVAMFGCCRPARIWRSRRKRSRAACVSRAGADQLQRRPLRIGAVAAFDRVHRAHAAAADDADDLPAPMLRPSMWPCVRRPGVRMRSASPQAATSPLTAPASLASAASIARTCASSRVVAGAGFAQALFAFPRRRGRRPGRRSRPSRHGVRSRRRSRRHLLRAGTARACASRGAGAVADIEHARATSASGITAEVSAVRRSARRARPPCAATAGVRRAPALREHRRSPRFHPPAVRVCASSPAALVRLARARRPPAPAASPAPTAPAGGCDRSR